MEEQSVLNIVNRFNHKKAGDNQAAAGFFMKK
jgi:hypothetical protein